MNAITQQVGAVASWQPPQLSPLLHVLIARVLNPHPSDFGKPLVVPSSVREEAERHLAAYELACKPAGRERLHRWLLVVNASVRNPARPGKPYDDAVDAMALCAELPAIAMTGKTQRLAALEWEMWPSQKELHGWLQAHAAPFVRTRDAMRQIVAGQTQADDVQHENRESVAGHVSAQVAALRSEMMAREARREEMQPTAKITMSKPLLPADLAAARQRAGIRVA